MNPPIEIKTLTGVVEEAFERNCMIHRAAREGFMRAMAEQKIDQTNADRLFKEWMHDGWMKFMLAVVTPSAAPQGKPSVTIQHIFIVDSTIVDDRRCRIDFGFGLSPTTDFLMVRGLITTAVDIDGKPCLIAGDYGAEDRELILKAWDKHHGFDPKPSAGRMH